MVSKSKILGKSALIFVTVGSTNFPFDRLFIAIDKALEELKSEAKLVVQMGCSSYKWKYKNVQFYAYLRPKEMEVLFSKADRIIAHGGPGTLFSLTNKSKNMPLVVARQRKYGEHVNDHQVEYVHYVRSLMPLQYKSFFIVDQDLSNNIKKFVTRNTDNVLPKYLSTSPNNLRSQLEIFLKTI